MTRDERQALRDKHSPTECPADNCFICQGEGVAECGECIEPYPCDAIKVLNAWEEQNEVIQDLCRSRKLYDDDYVRDAVGEMTE